MSKKPPQNFSPLAEPLEFILVFRRVKDNCHAKGYTWVWEWRQWRVLAWLESSRSRRRSIRRRGAWYNPLLIESF